MSLDGCDRDIKQYKDVEPLGTADSMHTSFQKPPPWAHSEGLI